MLKEKPTYPEALIGRGTAYAFQRELENAIDDFTKVFVYLTRIVKHSGPEWGKFTDSSPFRQAIQSNPAAGEAWKRRGQARAALGEFAEVSGSTSSLLMFFTQSVKHK